MPKKNLEHHLFHVKNPLENDAWMFNLYPERNFLNFVNGKGRRESWGKWTQFKAEEELTAISCLFGGLKHSAAETMDNNRINSEKGSVNFPSRYEKFVSTSGENLEILASVSAIESSHYHCSEPNNATFTLK